MPNVKAGDTAYIVGLPVPMLHTFVHVDRQAGAKEHLDGIDFEDHNHGTLIGWVCSGRLKLEPGTQLMTRRTFLTEFVIADKNLRPIRDSGDDAKDETLGWLPVPTIEQQKQLEKMV